LKKYIIKKMNFKNFKITNKGLYWGLIATFAILYLCVGFVSTLHSITFFHLANSLGLAILLGLTYELGQASVLFGLLMTKNSNKFLPWALMILLTALQVTANVYASFKFMANSGSNDWQYWQKSILIGVQAANPEMYQVIISWIAGALLPVVALGMTALVAQNMRFIAEEGEEEEKPKDVVKEFLNHEFKKSEEIKDEESKPVEMPSVEEQLDKFKNKLLSNASPQTELEENSIIGEGGVEVIKPEFQTSLQGKKFVDGKGVEWEAGEHPKVDFPPFKFVPENIEMTAENPDAIVGDEIKRRIKESADKKNLEDLKKDVQDAKDYLDEEIERPVPEINLPRETKHVEAEVAQIPTSIITEIGEPEVVISKKTLKEAEDATRRELGEKIPFIKTRGWHLKKTYIDSNGDIYHYGKFCPPEKEQSKKSKKV